MEFPEVDSKPLRGKLTALEKALAGIKALVAFSGGVDSTFLAYAAKLSCPDYLAVTVRSPLCPSWEPHESSSIAAQLNLKHRTLDMDLLSNEKVARNPRSLLSLQGRDLLRTLEACLSGGYGCRRRWHQRR